jgi:hypothetical protein
MILQAARPVIALYNRLEQLRERREEMEEKQGIIFRNETLDDAIAAVDAEIAEIEAAIKTTRKNLENKK